MLMEASVFYARVQVCENLRCAVQAFEFDSRSKFPGSPALACRQKSRPSMHRCGDSGGSEADKSAMQF